MKTFFGRFSKKKDTVAADTAECTVKDTICNDGPNCKILVVCKGYEFSDGVVEYAIDMATKTRSGLVALNLDEGGRNFSEFNAQAQQSIGAFSDKASEAGLLFSHEVRQGAHDSVIDQMYREDEKFRYVMDDTAAVCSSRTVIPVYTRATLRAK